jgi:hypothetical protein
MNNPAQRREKKNSGWRGMVIYQKRLQVNQTFLPNHQVHMTK